MYDFFVKLLNMSLAASIIILVIVVLRLLLKKAPRNIICFLWVLVALRLILPFSIQSDLSAFNMMPSSVDNQGQIEYFQYNGKTEKPQVEFTVPALVNDNASPDSMTIGEHTSDLYLPTVISIWLAGVCGMLLYAIGSYLYLRKKVGASIPRREGLKMSDDISTPFILGILKPVIYIPSGMDEKTLNHVIAHEEAHIKRKDHWWKPLGYFLLTVYWFNPMIWLAYVLLCRDIEMACDEKVIRDMDKGSVAAYSQALLDCSIPRRRIAACPLAFGEVGVKERVRSVLNYKKPAFWIIIAAIVACAIVAVCFLTNPAANRYYPMTGHSISELEPNQIVEWIAKLEKLNDAADLNTNSDNFDILLTSDFDIQNAPAIRYYFTEKRQVYCGQLRMFTDENRYFATKRTKWTEQNRTYKLQTYLEALKYLPQEQIRQLSPNADSYSVMIADGGSLENNARTISYTSTGVCSSGGWQIHLLVQPLHGGHGDGSEEIHLFYDATAVNYPVPTRWFDALYGDEMVWDGRREINLDEFPGVTFRAYSERIEAVTDKETVTLYTGMPIWSVYFCDLTGDGLPELCSSLSFGSGMIDNRVIIYDYANGVSYSMEDRGVTDYILRQNESDGQLYVDKKAYMGGGLLSTGQLVFEDDCLQVLWLEKPNDSIREITDPTDDPNFTYDTAVEKIFEDENNEYYIGGLYSQHIIVYYTDGTQENIVTALNAGKATIVDLDKFGIRYWAEPKEASLDTAISSAILEHYASKEPDGLIHVESHALLANEAMSGTPQFGADDHAEKVIAYLLVHHVKYSTYGGTLEAVGGSYIPTAITFKITDSGKYVLEEYWEPRDGSYYAKDIRGKFPSTAADDALNDQAYIEDLKKQNYNKALSYLNSNISLDVQIEELLNEIQSSPAHSSNPKDYIREHESEYNELIGYGKYTLQYCFSEFLNGEQTDLRGHIMALACKDISNAWGEAFIIDGDTPVTGQGWFDEFQKNAEALAKQYSIENLEKYYPASFLLLQMSDNDFMTK